MYESVHFTGFIQSAAYMYNAEYFAKHGQVLLSRKKGYNLQAKRLNAL